MNFNRYKAFGSIDSPNRMWPNRVIEKAPIWCSVDLRDGNQALEKPMNLSQKIAFFNYLVKLGFKEIEVGFPAASDTEFAFCRTLIEQNLIPDDVTIQVLTQSREHIIRRTFEALEGVNKAIVHLYNSTSTLQRDVVFNKSKGEIIDLAKEGASLVKELATSYGQDRFIFEYSPESFSGTELDFAVDICNAVLDIWQPTSCKKAIINLPNTVEMATANVHADQIEYMCNNINYRENVVISLHTHNDRGCAVASTELGLLAGADRVEGTLFGNGERTGNADILTIALNMFSQGIDPMLDLSNINSAIEIYESSTGLPVHPRHPYAGDLVYTAFSGSHQDAIKKGMAVMKNGSEIWEVPYLPIDPADVGRSYEAIIRINSQSGKGGVAYILEQNYGIDMPKQMQQDFGPKVTKASVEADKELTNDEIYNLFISTYLVNEPLSVLYYTESSSESNVDIECTIKYKGEEMKLRGNGNGIVDAFSKALTDKFGIKLNVEDYVQRSMGADSKSKAITYVKVNDSMGQAHFAIGISSNTAKSAIRAIASAVNRFSII